MRQVTQSFFGQMINVSTCSRCRGKGTVITKPCPTCSGTGRERKETTISVKIPPGVSTGNYITIRGEGNAGLNGGPAGDVIVVVDQKPHPIFERHGDDLLIRVPISLSSAALGEKVEVPTLGGKARLSIPAGTQSGKVFRLRGKGLPRLEGYGRGDELVEIVVWVPQVLDREEKGLLEQLAPLLKRKVPEPKRELFGGA